MSMLDIAIKYTRMGLKVLPIPHRSKNPGRRRWQQWFLTEEELPQHFDEHAQNIGVLTGEPSGWLVDVDLDHPQAVALADHHLPATPAVFGRAGKPRSHRIYRVTGPIATKQHKSKVHGTLVGLRSTGLQTVFPPSIHVSGEPVEWDAADAEPALVEPEILFDAVDRLADAVRVELGEKPKRKNAKQQQPDAPFADEDRFERCLGVMRRMKVADQTDGSHRLYAAACRAVEWDLDDGQAVACIQAYAKEHPFPREWNDVEIVQRIRDAEKRCARGAAVRARSNGKNEDDNGSADITGLIEGLDLFHDDDVGYATVVAGGHAETMSLRSRAFKRWLARWFYEHVGKAPPAQTLVDCHHCS